MNAGPFSLAGKTVLVTGAGSGIGRACALRAASLGAHVILTGRRREALAETFAALDASGHAIHDADLTDAVSLGALVKELPELDGVVHAAGHCELKPLRFSDAGVLRHHFAVNTEAPLLLTRELHMGGRLSDRASVVFIASVSAFAGESAMSAYAASKGALVAASRALALELAPRRIRVNAVAPGSVRTPMLEALFADMTEAAKATLGRAHPFGIGEPDDVACAVAYLLAPASTRVTGTTLTVDGGYLAR